MNLATTYLGMSLKNPLVASASPLSGTLDGLRRLEDGGVSAIVMFSLFEEQIAHEGAALTYLTEAGGDSVNEAASYFPALNHYHVGPGAYLDLIRRGAEALGIPLIASLNGSTNRGWVRYAKEMRDAGASAIELNIFHVPAGQDETGADVESRYVDILSAVKDAVDVPVALKLGPFFSAMGDMARRFDAAGADALVLFNRFYQPDLDLNALEVVRDLHFSSPQEIRLPLLWIAVLCGRIRADLAATTGVHNGAEIAKYLLAGATVAMSTSALMKYGPQHARTMLDELVEWMESRGYADLDEVRGLMSQRKIADPAAFERANYIRILENYKSPFTA